MLNILVETIIISLAVIAAVIFSDADECAMGTHSCDHLCTNRNGSYACACNESFALAPNGRSCIPVCGGHLNSSNGTFFTPGWPNSYPELDFTCEWNINVTLNISDGRKWSLRFIFNHLVFGLGSQCDYEYMEFYNAAIEGQQPRKFCSEIPPLPFKIPSTQVKVVFRSSSLHNSQQLGASVAFTTVEQGKQ